MSATETPYQKVVAALEAHGCKSDGNGTWTCPAHEDRTPSLSVSEGADGRALLHCHAGCELGAVREAAGIPVGDLFVERKAPSRRVVATYAYTDEAGGALFEVVRREPKDFRQRRPDPDNLGEWIWNLRGVRRVPYRLPALIAGVAEGRTVHVCEGEKDVHAVEKAGGIATTNPGGAGKWRTEYSRYFEGATVRIVADRDDAGRAHAEQVRAALADAAASVEVLEPTAGKDVSDHLDAGHGLDDLVPQAMTDAPPDLFLDWTRFWSTDRTEPEWLLPDVLARGRGHAIYAARKAGKSLFTLWCCTRLVRAGHLVVYLDFEMTEDDLHERLADMGHGSESDLSLLRYALLPSLLPLDTKQGGDDLMRIIDRESSAHPGRHVAVIIDTTARAVEGAENDADTFRDFYRYTGLGLKQRGATWARLDHAGKDATKGQRGSSSKGDDPDVVWHLSQTEGGLELRCDLRRMGWVPDRVHLRMVTEPVLTFEPTTDSWPAGTVEVAGLLDGLKVPLDAGYRKAQAVLKEAGNPRRANVINAAQRHRRMERESPPESPPATPGGVGAGVTDENPHEERAESPPESPGVTPAGLASECGSPLRGATPSGRDDQDDRTATSTTSEADAYAERYRREHAPRYGRAGGSR